MITILGALLVTVGGLMMGSAAWPFKLMRKYQFEHWWFIAMLVGLIVVPWTIVLVGCPHAIESIPKIPISAIALGNLFAVGWGIANVLYGLCLVRIGVALTGAILSGLGVSVGAIVPMVFKGSGLFQNAPSLFSTAGLIVCGGVVLMLVGVAIASSAGLGRHQELERLEAPQSNYWMWLGLTFVAGILSSFITFVFVYSQGPIVANLSQVLSGADIHITFDGNEELSDNYSVSSDGTIEIAGIGRISVADRSAWEAAEEIALRATETRTLDASKIRVDTGSFPATFGVFAIGLFGGAVVNLGYAGFMLSKNRSWGMLWQHPGELLLATITGISFSVAVALMGKGMLFLGVLGASVGWGIQQAMQMIGAQLLGFLSGEWRGVVGKPRRQMYLAIAMLIFAAIVLAYGNTTT